MKLERVMLLALFACVIIKEQYIYILGRYSYFKGVCIFSLLPSVILHPRLLKPSRSQITDQNHKIKPLLLFKNNLPLLSHYWCSHKCNRRLPALHCHC